MNNFTPHPTEAPLFADLAGDFSVSFEFFPPKTEKMDAALWEAVQTLAPLSPRFVSVTYGADGSTRDRTHQTVARIARETAIPPAAHLTCVGASKEICAVDRSAICAVVNAAICTSVSAPSEVAFRLLS